MCVPVWSNHACGRMHETTEGSLSHSTRVCPLSFSSSVGLPLWERSLCPVIQQDETRAAQERAALGRQDPGVPVGTAVNKVWEDSSEEKMRCLSVWLVIATISAPHSSKNWIYSKGNKKVVGSCCATHARNLLVDKQIKKKCWPKRILYTKIYIYVI